MSIATATHISKNTVRIVAEEGYEITMFHIRGEDIEVIVVSKDGTDAARLLVQGAKADEHVTIDRAADGSVTFVYRKVPTNG